MENLPPSLRLELLLLLLSVKKLLMEHKVKLRLSPQNMEQQRLLLLLQRMDLVLDKNPLMVQDQQFMQIQKPQEQ